MYLIEYKKINMKTINLATLFSFCFVFSLSGQNIIKNGSFEEVVDGYCPASTTSTYEQINDNILHWRVNTTGGVTLIDEWNTPDYFHSCSHNVNSSNFAGYQPFRTGEAYMGIKITNLQNINLREFLFQELEEPLEAGNQYSFTMYVSLAESTSVHGINSLGAAFVNNEIIDDLPTPQSLIDLNISPQIEHSEVISNTTDWTEISGTFVAQGGENYIIIGVFKNLSEIETEEIQENYLGEESLLFTYYYIEDVSLIKSLSSHNDFSQKGLTLYPNPSNDIIHISGIDYNDIHSINCYDVSGKRLDIEINREDTSFNISNLANGVYTVQLITVNNEILTQQIIKN